VTHLDAEVQKGTKAQKGTRVLELRRLEKILSPQPLRVGLGQLRRHLIPGRRRRMNAEDLVEFPMRLDCYTSFLLDSSCIGGAKKLPLWGS
jgi:hypothetical protein